MQNKLSVYIDPDDINSTAAIREQLRKQLRLRKDAIPDFVIRRKSIDARQKRPRFLLDIELVNPTSDRPVAVGAVAPKALSPKHCVFIVGAGPAGYFAALELLQHGIRPVVFERGKDVSARHKDIQKLHTKGSVDSDSNYCFGEGGAGTYSDGKLFTRAHKRGDVGQLLAQLVAHGAPESILIDAQPHIGSNRLPRVVKALRQHILELGGEIHFEAKVTDLEIDAGAVVGVDVQGQKMRGADAVILATGHSARELFELLLRKNVHFETKPFALGVRVEHPQALIDQIQYHHSPRHPNLPAAGYRLVEQVEGRGVFSFCMCPGGFMVPATTAPGELVINGMSLAARNAPYANSGIVVELRLEDIFEYAGDAPLAAMQLQRALERKAFAAGGNNQYAPAQRLTDFIAGVASSTLPECSYLPGVNAAAVHELFAPALRRRLQSAFRAFDKKMRGYVSNEALVLAVESRTSSPVRIPRDEETLMHPQVKGLYPCAEGAGYAGGIVSAALDGQRVARRIALTLLG